MLSSYPGVCPASASSANYQIDTTNRIDRTTPLQQAPRRGYACALIAPLGHATVVGDHFHAIRLANAVADQARRQGKQVSLVIGAAPTTRCTASASCW